MSVAENGAGNGRNGKHSKLRDAMDQYLPIRTMFSIVIVCGSVFIGGLKLEQFILDRFSSVEQQLSNLTQYMQQRGAQRDAQLIEMNAKITDLTVKVDNNKIAEDDALAAVNGRISNITNDLAILKCRMGKC